MATTRLSVCLLTRDEAPMIGRALRSVEGLADEVVVADTGSIDGTLKLVRDRGATLVPHTWTDDFSAGRNAALDAATGDWVLWLNADEELTPESHERVRALLADPAGDRVFGYLVRLRSIAREERPEQFTESFDLRLFRRRPDARYVGRLHPGFSTEFGQALLDEGWQVAPSDVVIAHHAYAKAVTPARLRWAARLLEKELADRPDRLHFLVEYGETLLKLGDSKGHEVMGRAAAQVLAHVDAPQPPSPEAARVLEYVINTPPEALQTALSADQAGQLALRWFVESPPLLWALASRYFKLGRFQGALVLLELLVRLGGAGQYDRSQPFDPRILGPWPLLNMGQCYRALGRLIDARRCFAMLLDDPEFGERAAQLIAETADPAAGAEPSPPA